MPSPFAGLFENAYTQDDDWGFSRYTAQATDRDVSSPLWGLLKGMKGDLYMDYIGSMEDEHHDSFKSYLEGRMGIPGQDDIMDEARRLNEKKNPGERGVRLGAFTPNLRYSGR